MGSRPCLVLVEWELLLIPLGWPMTEQTESCLFSGSVTEEGKTHREQERRERLENMQSTPRKKQTKKTAINQESFFSFISFHFFLSLNRC